MYSIYNMFKLEICSPINPLKISVYVRLNYLLNSFLWHTSLYLNTSLNFLSLHFPYKLQRWLLIQRLPRSDAVSSEKATALRLLCINAARQSQICINVCFLIRFLFSLGHQDNSLPSIYYCYLNLHIPQFEMHEIVIMNLEHNLSSWAELGMILVQKMPRVMRVTVETECVILELIKALRPIYCKCLHFCN